MVTSGVPGSAASRLSFKARLKFGINDTTMSGWPARQKSRNRRTSLG
jgi:hypothetical protein